MNCDTVKIRIQFLSMALLAMVCLENSVFAQSTNEGGWIAQYGSSEWETAYGVSSDHMGNIYIAGQTIGNLGGVPALASDAFVSRFDAAGNRIWTNQYGEPQQPSVPLPNELYNAVSADGLGNIYTAGIAAGEIIIAKYLEDGSLQWMTRLDPGAMDDLNGVSADALGNVFVTGSTYGSLGAPNVPTSMGYPSCDFILSKLNADGDVEWIRQLGSSGVDYGKAVFADGTGNVFVVGATNGDLLGSNKGYYDAFLMKYDSNGIQLWDQGLGTSHDDYAYGVSTDSMGNVYLAGETNGDGFLVQCNSEGEIQWQQSISSGPALDTIRGIASDSLGNVYVTGYTFGSLNQPNFGGSDVFVSKFTTNGKWIWTRQMGTSEDDQAWGIATDNHDRVYITGMMGGSLGGSSQGAGDIFLAQLPGPQVYAILIGSRAPTWDDNDVEYPDGIRGDLDADNMAAQLDWATDVIQYDFDYYDDTYDVACTIRLAIAEVAERITKDDVLIFYYSGHGSGGMELGVNETMDAIESESVDDDYLGFYLDDPRLNEVTKIILLDSCHSFGMLTPDGLPNESPLDRLPHLALFAAAPEDGFTVSADDGTGVWTNALLPLLESDVSLAQLAENLPYAYDNGTTTITGFFKDRGYGTMPWLPVSYFSDDLDPTMLLNGVIPPDTSPINADFDEDGDVDDEDFNAWQSGFGTIAIATHAQGDTDDDGDVDGSDFLVWQAEFGSVPAGISATTIPEPASMLLIVVTACAAVSRARRHT